VEAPLSIGARPLETSSNSSWAKWRYGT